MVGADAADGAPDRVDEHLLSLTEFLNLFPQRGPNLMWLLGAGASVASGIPSAATLTWEFKRAIYCNAERIAPTVFPDLYDPAFQHRVQSYFDSRAGLPVLGSDEEYSAYFELYLPDEGDRRRFLDAQMQQGRPSYGHLCLAALASVGKTRLMWTTNFDQVVERAFSLRQITDKLSRSLGVAGLDNPDKAAGLIRDEAWPVLVKLHGDFQYKRLKNTSTELQKQDETLRHYLIEECRRRGLVVVGYSGRDTSILAALEDALGARDPFPHGLFWCMRRGDRLSPNVLRLLERARTRNVQARVVEIVTFDELMADLFLPHQESLSDVRDLVKAMRPQRQAFTINYATRPSWPVLRTNGLHVFEFPASCTVFQAEIGGAADVKALVAEHLSDISAARRKQGIIAFGSRARLTEVFEHHNPRNFDRHVIDARRLRYDSPEAGLVYHALLQGIANMTGLARSLNSRGRFLFAPASAAFDREESDALRQLGSRGVWLPREGIFLHEGISTGLDFRDDRLWFLFEPTLVVTTDGRQPYRGKDRSELVRETLARRYNRQTNALVHLWLGFLQRHLGNPMRVAFPSASDAQALFNISATTAFSRQA